MRPPCASQRTLSEAVGSKFQMVQHLRLRRSTAVQLLSYSRLAVRFPSLLNGVASSINAQPQERMMMSVMLLDDSRIWSSSRRGAFVLTLALLSLQRARRVRIGRCSLGFMVVA